MTIKTEDVRYTDGPVSCLGFLAYDDAQAGKRPGVFVVHEAWGLGEHAKERAKMLAGLGYVALAADMYGDRRQAAKMEDLGVTMGPLRENPDALRARAKAGVAALAGHSRVDASKLFAIGFCFGGMTVLELARAGSDLLGVVSFHGALETKLPAAKGAVKASVLVCTGADDPMVPPNLRTAFEDEMRQAGADWQVMAYGNTQHSFTNPAADGSIMPGIVYNESTDKRSWRLMNDFFAERLKAR
jgi:dienelactone hydrolase